jgi:hypothetical protein
LQNNRQSLRGFQQFSRSKLAPKTAAVKAVAPMLIILQVAVVLIKQNMSE